uniref:Uncharacterized protein n=1 Tax=Rangifer tarandus platyrhynchus TaxID=3082113 RepID=A0ACB0DPN1_RANTA|nr:unnamed protein product [Rangifer tarandus platyrhynchus]
MSGWSSTRDSDEGRQEGLSFQAEEGALETQQGQVSSVQYGGLWPTPPQATVRVEYVQGERPGALKGQAVRGVVRCHPQFQSGSTRGRVSLRTAAQSPARGQPVTPGTQSLSPTWQKGKIHRNQVCPEPRPLQSCFMSSSSSPNSAPVLGSPEGGQCPELPPGSLGSAAGRGSGSPGPSGPQGASPRGLSPAGSLLVTPPRSPSPATSSHETQHTRPHLRQGQ